MHDMEEEEGILEREIKGKQNMVIGKDEELCKWTHLPCDILELIMERLKLIDYLGIRGVCSSWRATINKAIANKHFQPLPELPLVYLRSRNKSVFPSRFFSISTGQACSIESKSTQPERKHECHGIVDGWMILSEKLAVETKILIFFLNPVTNDVVKVQTPLNLPSESPIPDRSDLYAVKMVASSSPKCEDCVVVGLFTEYAHIAYCRVNSKESWIMIEAKREDLGSFMDVEILNGKLYVSIRTNILSFSLLVYDLQDSSGDPPKPTVIGEMPLIRPLPQASIHDNEIHVKGNVLCFLARGYASGELLLIYLFHNSVYEADKIGYMKTCWYFVSPPQITKCEVYKFDTSTNKWAKLDKLGDRVVFIGSPRSFVMSRATLNSSEELITENTIYFALYMPSSKPWMSVQLWMLCLTDNSIGYFCLEQFEHELGFFPLWLLPSAW